MKIAVLANGSRGDVQPLLTLAYHLVAQGHDVTLAVPEDFLPAAVTITTRAVGLPAVRGTLDQGSLLDSLRRGHTITFFREAFEIETARRQLVAEHVMRACEGAELLVASALVEDLALTIAEARRQRVVLVLPMPNWANSRYPAFFWSNLRMPGFMNRLSYWLFEYGARAMVPVVNELRAELGLAPIMKRPGLLFQRSTTPVLYWVPALVLPPPVEYGANHRFTGYWLPPPAVRAALGEAEPPAALSAFLAAGPPPIFVCFGSMPIVDDRVLDIVAEVAARLDLRVVVGRGWSRTGERATERMITVDGVDHDWLLPRCVAAIHHGGASTTGAVLRAGVPQVVVAVFVDQPLWGRRVAALGVGVTFRFQQLGVRRLERALRTALSSETRRRAMEVADALRAQPDGGALAARTITDEGAGYPIPSFAPRALSS